MRERVSSLIARRPSVKSSSAGNNNRGEDEDASQRLPTVCTFHSLCVRILRQHIDKLGYKRNFVIYDQSEQISAIKKILSKISAKGEKTDPDAILSLLSKFRNGGEQSAAFSDESVRAMAQHIRQHYETALRACNAVDFDDLILLTLRLFKEHPDALESCRGRFRYVMVDEYQDTNSSQFELVHALTGQHRNLCVVGDDDQSIYGWRGAEISNLLDMEKYFPEVKVVKLEQNYRSTNNILNAANAVIRNNLRRRGKRLWSQNGDGPKIALHAYRTDEEEAKSVAEHIEYARQIQRVPWVNQAILFRTNIQSRPLETALRQASIRYHLIGGQSFFDRREVRDFLAYLKVFINPRDDVSLLRIANVPARGLSEVTMERMLAASHERNCSVFETMKNPLVMSTFQSKTREHIEGFVQFIERGREFLETPFNAAAQSNCSAPASLEVWADKFLNEIGYFAELKRSEKAAEAAEARIRNLRELMADLNGHCAAKQTPLEGLQIFIEQITLDTEREEDDENPGEAVTLITMHSCKGLEFPHVYVVGLEEDLLPHSRSKTEGTLDEERRLFYVAITRAKQYLSISHCSSRKKYGAASACYPSRFLTELPAELVEHSDDKARQPVAAESGKSFFDALRGILD
jgi:superfamily I DNA/RNA helicase